MRNGTVTTFILLGLTDDPELQGLIFIFLFLTYTLSLTRNLTIITLTFVDSHLKTPMHFSLKNFFLEISLTSSYIPRYLYSTATDDRVNTYNVVSFKYLLRTSVEQQNFFCWPPCPVTVTWPSANPCTMWPSWAAVCRILIIFCWMAGLCVLIPPLRSEVAQSCPTLSYPMDYSLTGSSIHGIFQARILEWVAISFFRGSSRPRDRTQVSRIVGSRFTVWATREVPEPEFKSKILWL